MPGIEEKMRRNKLRIFFYAVIYGRAIVLMTPPELNVA
jgi:hypothetical protein